MKPVSLTSRGWFILGVLSTATFGAFANLPRTGGTSGSLAPTQEVSEIKAQRHRELSFDQDLTRLSMLQGRYRENLPTRKGKAPVKPVRAKVGQR